MGGMRFGQKVTIRIGIDDRTAQMIVVYEYRRPAGDTGDRQVSRHYPAHVQTIARLEQVVNVMRHFRRTGFGRFAPA